MFKKMALQLAGLLCVAAHAAGPQGDPQIYSLASPNKDQVVMLSNWPDGKTVAVFNDYNKLSGKFFKPGQTVWVSCGGRISRNQIADIRNSHDEIATTNFILETDPRCKRTPLLLSNHPFPKSEWTATQPSQKELAAIRGKFSIGSEVEVTKIVTSRKGVFFSVFDPTIPAIYDVGGHRLLDGKLNQISMVEQAPLTPLIDLDGDSVPEFFFPSSDGFDAWLYRLYPQVDREMSHTSKAYKGIK
jgi:hypothetical protein